MKFKKIALLLTIILSQSAFSEANTAAKVHYFNRDNPVPRHHDAMFMSHHEYVISNNTGNNQNISVCYDLVSCPEDPYNIQKTRDCQSFVLPAWQTRREEKDISLMVNIPFAGWCHIYAQTTTTGGTYSRAFDEKTFEIR